LDDANQFDPQVSLSDHLAYRKHLANCRLT
jgi:hypothetical protein